MPLYKSLPRKSQSSQDKKVRMIFTFSSDIAADIKKYIPSGKRSQLVEESLIAIIQQLKRKAWFNDYQKRPELKIKRSSDGWGNDVTPFKIS